MQGNVMPEMIAYFTLAVAAVAAICGLAVFLRTRTDGLTEKQIADLLRMETDRQRQVIDDLSRALRQELGDSVRGFQDATLTTFRELGQNLAARIGDFGTRLDIGIKAIDDRAATIGTKLDQDLRQMGEDAGTNRDALRQAIDAKLDDAATKQTTASRELRQEVTETINRMQETLVKSVADQRTAQSEQFEAFARRLAQSLTEVNQRGEEMKTILSQSLVDLANASDVRHQSLLNTLDAKLKELAEGNLKTAAAMREEIAASFVQLGNTARESLTVMSNLQKERLDTVVTSLNALTERHEKAQEALRQTVETRLETIRTENSAKLKEIRKTVDEQLKVTLSERITNSFKMVNDQLEQVYRGLGEMQKLAGEVGDLKRVLANVKTRGVFGEVQLGSLMEQMFSADQYIENAQVNPNSQERVDFAVKIPGRSGEGDVLLPIDAKFPIEDYDRLLQAADRADIAAVEAAGTQLEIRIRGFAKDISEKYVNPPLTTDIAILFLPIEGLYAEVLRRPGVVESIQQTHHVVIAGPTTLLAMLSAFRMAIQAVAIQQRSTEVWRLLGAVRTEFDKHGGVLARLHRQLEASLNTVDALGTRTKVMRRKLQGVDSIGDDKIPEVLGLSPSIEEVEPEDAMEQT
jgi:DNA recombination protein RmuC